MKNWSALRAAFGANSSLSDDVESPALKQARRATSPPPLVKNNSSNNKWSHVRAVVENTTNTMPFALPAISGRREKTFHLGPSETPQPQPQIPRRFSSFGSPLSGLRSNDELHTDTPPDLGAGITANSVAFRFSKALLNRGSKSRSSMGNNLTPNVTFCSIRRDPGRVPLYNLFRATAQSVSAWFALFHRAAKFTPTAINLTDIMSLTNTASAGGGGGGGDKKEAKKSTPTAALDNDGNVVKFNMDDYKSNITMKLTDRAKRILMRHPDRRTDEDVHYVMIALKSVPQISEYPLTILRLIVRYGFFESFEARRVLIRQGHRPAAFYFILYGDVAVAVCPDPGEPAKLAVKLKRGESFGELAIITGSPRQSTCVTLGYCEFIKLWKEEYVQIFKVGGMANFNNSEVLQFLRSSDLMSGWPVDLLKTNPEVIVFSYFKAGSVVVKDIRKSPWLIILKSGRADAIAVIPKKGSVVSEKTGRLQRESERSARQALGILFHLSKPEFDRELSSSRFRKLSSSWSNSRLPMAVRSLTSVNFYVEKRDEEAVEELPVKSVVSASRAARLQTVTSATSRQNVGSPTPSPRFNQRRGSSAAITNLSVDDTETDGESKRKAGRKTMFNILNAGNEADDNETASPNLQNFNQNQQYDFITLQQLGPGNVFGLESQLKLTDCRLLLLSQGCECILLNWNFFRQHCSNIKLAQVHTWAVSSCYPTAKAVEEMYQDEVNWLSYRKFLINATIESAKSNTL